MKTGHTAKYMGWLKLRAIKGTSQVAIVLPGSTLMAKNSLLKLKDGWYRKIVADLETTNKGFFIQEIIEAHE